MGHSLVSSRPYSPVLDLRPSAKQSKDMCLKYGLMHSTGNTYQESRKVDIGWKVILSSCFQWQQILILSGSS